MFTGTQYWHLLYFPVQRKVLLEKTGMYVCSLRSWSGTCLQINKNEKDLFQFKILYMYENDILLV